MKRFFVAVVCAVGLFTSAPAQAAPILVTDSDNLLGTVLFDLLGTPVAIAISGASGAVVVDGGPIAAGVIAAADQDTSLFVDFDANDALFFDFNYATSVFNAGVWTLAANGIPIFLTDPALLPFVGVNVGQFSILTLEPFFQQDTQVGFLGVYALDFIAAQNVTAVPEPATLGLVAMGLAAAVRRRRQQRKNT